MNRRQLSRLFTFLSLWACLFLLFRWYFDTIYLHVFNSDSAANYLVAEAIDQEGRPFPWDFLFGNDIMVLRPQFMIAAVRALGVTGYPAYALACSLIASTTIAALAIFVLAPIAGGLGGGVIAALLTFLPLGFTEAEFLFGQQSHLLQLAFSIVVLATILRWREDKAEGLKILIGLCLFLLTFDSKPRATIFLVAAAGALALLGGRDRKNLELLRPAAWGYVGGLVAAALVASRVQFFGIGWAMAPASFTSIMARPKILLDSFTDFYLGLAAIPHDSASALFKIAFALAMLVFIGFIVLRLTRGLIGLLKLGPTPIEPPIFFGSVGFFAILASLPILFLLSIEDNIRHVLIGLDILKLGLILQLIAWWRAGSRSRVGAIAGALTLAAASVPATAMLQPRLGVKLLMDGSPFFANNEDLLEVAGKLRSLPLTTTEPPLLFATFWNSQAVEVLSGEAVAASPIAWDKGELWANNWLTRPSRWRRKEDDAIFLLHEDDDRAAIAYLQDRRALLLATTGKYRLYQASSTLLRPPE